MVRWLDLLLKLIEGEESSNDNDDLLLYINCSLDLLVDLLSIPEEQPHLIKYLDAIHFNTRCKLSTAASSLQQQQQQHVLTRQLLKRIYALTAPSLEKQFYHRRATIVQKLCQKYFFDDTKDIVFAGVGLLCDGKSLRNIAITDKQLCQLLTKLRLVAAGADHSRDYLVQLLIEYTTIPSKQSLGASSYSVYPTKNQMWGVQNVIPPSRRLVNSKNAVLNLPKLTPLR